MRLLLLLIIFQSIVICNLLISTQVKAAQGNEIRGAAASALDTGGGVGSGEGTGAGGVGGQDYNNNINNYINKQHPFPPTTTTPPSSQQQHLTPISSPAPSATPGEATSQPSLSLNPQRFFININTSNSPPNRLNSAVPHYRSPSNYLQPSPTPRQQPTTKKPDKICPGIHIRNDLESFEQLRGCEIIDGPLTIALVNNHSNPYEPKDYENLSFPLREVTEYLLFFRVQGLSSLSGLFPNLTVIRGKELVSNYALIIYEMMHLQKIYLPKLSDILRGSVRIESNPNLCYVSTVNWGGICKHVFTPHFIKDNNPNCNNICPDHCRPWNPKLVQEPTKLIGDFDTLGSENNRSLFCWTNQVCQEMCQNNETGVGLPLGPDGGCCSSHCAGGCLIEDSPYHCISCRSVSQNGSCVEKCERGLFEYKGHCKTKHQCTSITEITQQDQCSKSTSSGTLASISNFKAIPQQANEKHSKCQVSCPTGYEEDPTNKNECKPCEQGKCRKVCTHPEGSHKLFMVTNVNSLRELSECNVINGSLEISMKGGRNVLHELETVFQDLEEIKGYLKITRSYPIITLGFLSKLKAINGSELDRGQYSLIIIDNPNLQELFMFNSSNGNQKQLDILNGKIFVHLNPKLCPHRIDVLKSYASVALWDERDVSIHTNGDKEACNTQKLEVLFHSVTARQAIIKFQNYATKMDDPRSLLYYLINYREASNGTVTMFDGRDGCSSQNDLWQTIEEPPIYNQDSGEYQEAIIEVKPATRYALYIKTFTIFAGSTGALSDIIYFDTAPDTPGIPKQIEGTATSHDQARVSWLPPSRPNGIIEEYRVTIEKREESEDLQNMDTCDSVANRDKITKTISLRESYHAPLNLQARNTTSSNGSSTTDANMCSRTSSSTDVDLHEEVVSFQDVIIDIIYLKQPCARVNSPSRKRRSIDYKEASPLLRLKRNSDQATISDVSDSKVQLQSKVKFDQRKGKIEHIVKADKSRPDGRMTLIILDLEHFSTYTIEVFACHKTSVVDKAIPSKTYKNCSIPAVMQIRTEPIDDYDKVSLDSIIFNAANETSDDHYITWKKPEKPNGLVLAYRVRYRPQGVIDGVWTETCINNTLFNRDGGFFLRNLSPGSYFFEVQTVSMSPKQRLWSPPFPFEIPPEYFLSPALLTLLIVIVIVVIAFAVASGTYYYQKKRHELTNGTLLYASVNPDYVQYDPDEWEVDKSNLVIEEQIGTGSFGMVCKGQLKTEKGTLNCAIKTVFPTSTAKQRIDFLREASIMKQFDTFHVVKLIGVVSTTTPVHVIMEFMEHGDLKKYLRKIRVEYQKEGKPLVSGIYLMAAQIADGMAYLASKKFVHRDLAARNCMVGENGIVKIGDFGLTRDVYANDYYRRDTQACLPVRWMAPESLSDNLYTSASDVWSYGIVVWEMVTFSNNPYQGLSNDEVIKRVIQGYTMPRPENCPDKLFYVMERCWKKNDRERLTFNELVEYLLPETEDKLYPNCFYRKQKTEGDSIAQPIPEENNAGGESYPLLSWPSNRANGLTNGVNHVQSDISEKKVPLA